MNMTATPGNSAKPQSREQRWGHQPSNPANGFRRLTNLQLRGAGLSLIQRRLTGLLTSSGIYTVGDITISHPGIGLHQEPHRTSIFDLR